MNKRQIGKAYEAQAAEFLEKYGFVCREQNFNCRRGEIDLVGIHEGWLVFVEVKYRKNKKAGMPEEAVGEGKQAKICLVSDYYRMLHKETAQMQVRYDVVAVYGNEIFWYKNAFPYRRKYERQSW